MSIFLGCDGGGTKTAFTLVTGEGQVAASATGPSCYYLAADAPDGLRLVDRVLRDGLAEVCAAAGTTPGEITYAFFGLPGYGELRADLPALDADLPALDAAPRALLGHDRYRCDNDMVCGWAGSLGGADGINVISGTGSMTYGERAGRGVRVGGWGEVFGDEGSGYWIGQRGLAAFSRMSDGRMPPGPLLELLRDRLQLEADLDLVDLVLHRWQRARREIAALSRDVVAAARAGDDAAAAVLVEAGAELAALVDATRHRLGFAAGETVPVSYSGGVFAADEVRAAFADRLLALDPSYRLSEPMLTPDLGAALYAAKLAGTPLDRAARDRLVAAAPGARRA